MADGKRKHVRTGNPRGGKRPNAGRPEGSTNALSYGDVQAIKAANLRLPETAPPELKAVANRAFERIIEVMECQTPPFMERAILAAATRIREEVCGPLAQRLEHSGSGAVTVVVKQYTGDDNESETSAEVDGPPRLESGVGDV